MKSFRLIALSVILCSSSISFEAFAQSMRKKAHSETIRVTCNLSASETWTIPAALSTRNLGPVELIVQASSQGLTCATARLTYTVRSKSNQVLYQVWFSARDIALTSEAHTPEQMLAALARWVSTKPNNDIYRHLPEWHAGNDQPNEEEARFEIAPGITRQAFLRIKALGTPIHCFFRNLTSVQCLIFDNGTVLPFGRKEIPSRQNSLAASKI